MGLLRNALRGLTIGGIAERDTCHTVNLILTSASRNKTFHNGRRILLGGQITSSCFVPASLKILNHEKDLNVKSIFYETVL